MTKEELKKEAKEYSTSSKVDYVNNIAITLVQLAFKDGAEFGYKKAKEEMQKSALNSLAEAIETWW